MDMDHIQKRKYQFQDLTGERFGRLLVLQKAEDIISPNGDKVKCYLCQCDCGSPPKIIRAGHLKNGTTKSCGCLNREKTSEREKNIISM